MRRSLCLLLWLAIASAASAQTVTRQNLANILAFATLQGLNLNGTRNWTQYSISVPAVPDGKQIYFGFLLAGTGKGWVDDLQLLVDGQPVALAGPRVATPLNTDHEFDQGSRVN